MIVDKMNFYNTHRESMQAEPGRHESQAVPVL